MIVSITDSFGSFHPINTDLAPPKSPPPENIKGTDFYCFYCSPLSRRLSSWVPFGAASPHRRRRVLQEETRPAPPQESRCPSKGLGQSA